MAVLAAETTEGTNTIDQTMARDAVLGKDITAAQGIGTTDIGTVPTGTGTISTSTSTVLTGTVPTGTGIGTFPADTGTTPAGKEAGNIPMTGDDLEAVAALDTLTDKDIDASLDGWLG